MSLMSKTMELLTPEAGFDLTMGGWEGGGDNSDVVLVLCVGVALTADDVEARVLDSTALNLVDVGVEPVGPVDAVPDAMDEVSAEPFVFDV